MGAYLTFNIAGYFNGDLNKAEVYFKKVIRYIDRNNEVGRTPFYNPAIVPLLDSLRIVFGEKIYEIRKSNPKLIELPPEKQEVIFKDIIGLGCKYDYHDPKHGFIYEMKEIMLPLEPASMWDVQDLVTNKWEVGLGFYEPFNDMKLDDMTRKTIKKASWHMLVLTLST